jgi:tRNA (cytidine/uridine-2'-O-)-methyltransferase
LFSESLLSSHFAYCLWITIVDPGEFLTRFNHTSFGFFALESIALIPARERRSESVTAAAHVVLVHPEIHWNTGNAGRTCLAAGATLHLIQPLGFSLSERRVKRAGLDYWKQVDVQVWKDWSAFEKQLSGLGDPFFFSARATQSLWDAPLDTSNGVVLVFGSESKGLPVEFHEHYRERLFRIPTLSSDVRSLNLSTSVGIVLYEVLRQRKRSNPG